VGDELLVSCLTFFYGSISCRNQLRGRLIPPGLRVPLLPLCNYLKAETDGSSERLDNIPLQELLLPPKSCEVGQMSTTDLAYIGDVVYELFIRSRTVWPPKRTSDLQLQVVALVRGKYNVQR
jgi:hypothetical protein